MRQLYFLLITSYVCIISTMQVSATPNLRSQSPKSVTQSQHTNSNNVLSSDFTKKPEIITNSDGSISTTLHNNDNTKTVTTVSPNKLKTVTIYNSDNKPISETHFDHLDRIYLLTMYHADGSQTQTSSDFHKKIKITNEIGADSKITSQTIINEQGKIIQKIQIHQDGSQSQMVYNPSNNTTNFNEVGANGQVLSQKITDSNGKTIRIINNNKDETFTSTESYSNGTQIIDILNTQGDILRRSFINESGQEITINGDLLISYHEASHAISFIKNQTLSLITKLSIQRDPSTKNLGHGITLDENSAIAGVTQSSLTYLVSKNNNELENEIIAHLCGGIGDQIAVSQKMFTEQKDILNFFNNGRYTGDLPPARQAARKIITINSHQMSDADIEAAIDEKIVILYQKGYQFIYKNKSDVEKLSQQLEPV